MNNKSVFEVAREMDSEAKLMTFCDVFKILLKNLDCVVCLESAADLLGYSNGGFTTQVYVYSSVDFNLPYIKCFIVDNLDNIPFIDFNGIKVSPINNAIVDMLRRKESDSQVLYETFANYYDEHNNSYEGLDIPPELSLRAKHFEEEGVLYYEQ